MTPPVKKPAAPALGDARARLKRLLLLVPLVSRHPGRPVDEIAHALGITRDELLEDLDLATMVGRPPFQPDDFVDVYVEDDRVYVEFDQRFSRPPRLTTAEAVALAAAANLLKGDGDDALARAVAKLERVLPAGAGEAFRALHGRLDTAPGAPGEVPSLTRALAESREVEFDYLAASRGVPEHRRVRPRELLQRGGAWYLSAFCLARQEERLFRLDRVARLEVTDTRFPALGPAGQASPPAATHAQVRFGARAALSVKERFGDDARDCGGGEVEVSVPADSLPWLTQWVLSWGGEATVRSPPEARAALAAAARKFLAD